MRTLIHITFAYNHTSQAHRRQVWPPDEGKPDVSQACREGYEGRRMNNSMKNQKESGHKWGQQTLHSHGSRTGLSTVISEKRRGQSSWLFLVLDAYIKAERARQRWKIAQAAGDAQAAKCARL
jgi:hypothetical protein